VELKAVYEIDPASGEVTRTFPGRIESHALSPDGTRLYGVTRDEVIKVWNLDTGAEERSLPSVSGFDAAITPDGQFLYLVWGAELRVVDSRSGALVSTLDLRGDARNIAMPRDGVAAIGNMDWGIGAGWIDFIR
jgi:DNA-binding beta-propeller fold protein YncE